MFSNLVASGGARRRTWTPLTTTVSVAVHGLLLAGAVWASTRAPVAETERKVEEVTYVDIAEEPVAPPPPPPEAAPPPMATDVPPAPKGFQELTAPIEPPEGIPEEDPTLQAVKAEDFRGIGVAGGRADGVEGAPPVEENQVFEVADIGVKPEIANLPEVRRTVQRLYPRLALDAGMAGQAVLRFVILEDGTVDPSSVVIVSSTDEQFASAGRKAIARFRFRPIEYRGAPVRLWATLPIGWAPDT